MTDTDPPDTQPPPAARGVLITRPEPGAGETAARLAARGFVAIVAPVLTIRPLATDLPAPGDLQAVLVASGRAVDVLPASHRGIPLLAVGDATAERARRAGHARVHSAAGDASALADLAACLCDRDGKQLLVAAGRGQGLALCAELRERGFGVERRAVYAAEPAPSLPQTARRALGERGVSAALFFSTDTARTFARLVRDAHLNDILGEVDALAISAKVADALAPLSWRRVRAALSPNQDEVLALLA